MPGEVFEKLLQNVDQSRLESFAPSVTKSIHYKLRKPFPANRKSEFQRTIPMPITCTLTRVQMKQPLQATMTRKAAKNLLSYFLFIRYCV
jgi:hypothetical protein